MAVTLTVQTDRTREVGASPRALSNSEAHVGLPALDSRSGDLFATALPRGVRLPGSRQTDVQSISECWRTSCCVTPLCAAKSFSEKLAGRFLGRLDDRALVTVAGMRAAKTSTVVGHYLHLYPGSMLVLDPEGELSRTARLRRALRYEVHIRKTSTSNGELQAQ